jgi:hypothetical protein
MIKFTNTTSDQHKPYTAVENIEMTISDEASLPDLLEAFEGFLRASGYSIPSGSYIDIVQDDENVIKYNNDAVKFTIVE